MPERQRRREPAGEKHPLLLRPVSRHRSGTDPRVKPEDDEAGLRTRPKLSPATIKRMVSYFAPHEIGKRAKNFGNDVNPSPGYVAWLL